MISILVSIMRPAKTEPWWPTGQLIKDIINFHNYTKSACVTQLTRTFYKLLSHIDCLERFSHHSLFVGYTID